MAAPAPTTPAGRPPVSALARLGMWCGIAAWVAALATPVLRAVASLIVYPLAVLAVAIGGFARYQIRRYPALWRGAGLALAGIILGGIWLLVLIAAFLFGR